jgi:diguanylate cyclase (GGDEF)-like protein
VGRLDEAVAVLEPACSATLNEGEDCDAQVVALLTLTEIQRTAGELDAAQSSLDRCRTLIDRFDLTGQSPEQHREQAEVYAASGRFREAYASFKVFHAADAELRALERDGRARTLHAIFEATEARRSSEHFRELSVRDPLTGLHNRRHVDSRLDELLTEVERHGRPLALALLDLDNFKRVNDTRSHAVGDEVLRVVAGILTTAARTVAGGLAARIGGEEFLLVLPGVNQSDGLVRMERLRQDIADHAWAAVTDGVPVTCSIGFAAAPTDAVERSALLSRADQYLYAAKRAGRDCVVGSAGDAVPSEPATQLAGHAVGFD